MGTKECARSASPKLIAPERAECTEAVRQQARSRVSASMTQLTTSLDELALLTNALAGRGSGQMVEVAHRAERDLVAQTMASPAKTSRVQLACPIRLRRFSVVSSGASALILRRSVNRASDHGAARTARGARVDRRGSATTPRGYRTRSRSGCAGGPGCLGGVM